MADFVQLRHGFAATMSSQFTPSSSSARHLSRILACWSLLIAVSCSACLDSGVPNGDDGSSGNETIAGPNGDSSADNGGTGPDGDTSEGSELPSSSTANSQSSSTSTGGDAGESTSDTSDTSESATGNDNICDAHLQGQVDLKALLSCGGSDLCDLEAEPWLLWCPSDDNLEEAREAHRCIFEALAASTPGIVRGMAQCFGWEDVERIDYFQVFSDRSVRRVRDVYVNGGHECTNIVESCELADAAFFRDCLEPDSGADPWFCMVADYWVKNCESDVIACNED